jgi:putative flippase GtrA
LIFRTTLAVFLANATKKFVSYSVNKGHKKIMNYLCVGVIGLYVNFMVFLLTDYSLWYFFGIIICIWIFVCVSGKLQKYK